MDVEEIFGDRILGFGWADWYGCFNASTVLVEVKTMNTYSKKKTR